MCNITMLQYCTAMLIATLSLCEFGCGTFTVEEGPYELIVHNTSDCLMREQSLLYTNVTAFVSNNGETLLQGTVIFKQETKSLKYRIRLYYIDNGQMAKAFDLKNLNCHNLVVKLVLATIGLPHNEKKCIMKPGTNEFRNLNLNSVSHSVVQSLWYGDLKVRWEIAVPAQGQIMCLDISLTSKKPKDMKTKL